MAIIGISGKMGSGKNTVGEIIKTLCDTNNGPNFEQKAFAGKLKEIACILTGCTLEQLEDQEFKKQKLGPEWEMTYRDLLQKLGTEAMRNGLHENVWVNALFADYKEHKPPKGDTFDYLHTECIDCKKAFNGYKRQFICNDCYESHNWYPNWIITDMRFPNEFDAIKSRGGITIRVNRIRYISTHSEGEHESERALDNHNFDYVIDNNGSMSDLILKVREILTQNQIIYETTN